MYNFNNVLAIYHQNIYSRLQDQAKIIHYTTDKPFQKTKPNDLSNPAFLPLWNLWYRIHDEMLNQSLTAQI